MMAQVRAQCNKTDNAYNAGISGRQPTFIQLPRVLARTAQSKSQWYLMIQRGEAPAPIKIGRSSVWLESEIDTWIDERVQASRGLQ